MEWSLLLLPLPVVQVAVAHPVDDLGQLADSAQLADYYSGHFVTQGAGERARSVGRDSKSTMARDETRNEEDTSEKYVAVQTPHKPNTILSRSS